MTTRYQCTFSFLGRRRTPARLRVTIEGGIRDFAEGFWLNNDYEFTKGSDCRFWIPPARIHYITKLEELPEK